MSPVKRVFLTKNLQHKSLMISNPDFLYYHLPRHYGICFPRKPYNKVKRQLLSVRINVCRVYIITHHFCQEFFFKSIREKGICKKRARRIRNVSPLTPERGKNIASLGCYNGRARQWECPSISSRQSSQPAKLVSFLQQGCGL